jgi:hypothetical protein
VKPLEGNIEQDVEHFHPKAEVRPWTVPSKMKGEKALLIYPVGTADADPEELIEFEALSPVPKALNGFNRRRALVTIELFRLDDSSGRKSLFKQRAALVRLLFLELEGRAIAKSAERRQSHQNAIDGLTSPEAPFTSCLRSFERLYGSDQARAEEIFYLCENIMGTKSTRRRGAR